MLGALLYLRVTSLRNWLRVRLRRLRQPKYFAGAVAFAVYFWFFFYRPVTQGVRPGRPDAAALQAAGLGLPALDWIAVGFAVGALILLGILVLMWVVPTKPATLGFSEAEIAFLFPAPITRPALVHFRLLSGQFRSLVGGVFMMLFSHRWENFGGNAFTHAAGWWFVFSALNLHLSGAGFTLTRLANNGLGTWRRRAMIVSGVLLVIGFTLTRLPPELRYPRTDLPSVHPFANWVLLLTDTAPLSWLLWPFKLIIGPFLAENFSRFLLALGPALAVIVLHYFWVVRTAVAFEDASIEHAEKRAARVAAWRSGNRRINFTATKGRAAPFRLGGHGRPEIAFLWKNLLSTWPYFTPRIFAVCALVIAAACTWIGFMPAWSGWMPGIGFAAAVFAVYTLVVGPQFARQDLRSDLLHLDILKTYPLSGWQIVLGQILTPVAILSAVLWLALLTAVMTVSAPRGMPWFTSEFRVVTTLVTALLIPAIVTLQLLVPNASALLFPGWFQANRGRGGGMEVVGQRMIFFFAQLLTMILALLPPLAFAGLLIFILQALVGAPIAVVVAGLAMLVILLGEVWCGVWWLGERFDRLDFSADARP